MAHVSSLPFDRIPPNVQNIMQTYDKEYGGSDFVKVFAHAPETFQAFCDYYFPLIFETRHSVDMKLTEMVRLKVAQNNDCAL